MPETTSGPDPAGNVPEPGTPEADAYMLIQGFLPAGDGQYRKADDSELDDIWYEAYADKVHSFGKKWPDPLTNDEEHACATYADSIVRRPETEMWDHEK